MSNLNVLSNIFRSLKLGCARFASFLFRYFASRSETQSVSLSFRYFSRKNKMKILNVSHVFASNFSLQYEAKK
jgi:hypothetical protein